MKINYTLLLFLFCSVFALAQNNDFTNGDGDLLWSNSANWSQGVVPNTTNTGQVRMPLTLESMVDTNISIKKIQTTFATGGDVPIAGSGTLTIDPGANNNNAIENVSNNDVAINFKGNLEINNSAGGFTLMRSLNGNSNAINFETGSTLTLTTSLATINGSSGDFNYNGSITGSGNLRLGPNTINTFGSTASNPDWSGDLVFLLNSQAIVNTLDNNIFYDGPKIQVNGNNSSIEVNGANVFVSGITVGGGNTFTFTANKNQNNMGGIVFQNNGTLNLTADNGVTNLSFEDNSASAWNSGTLNITGFKEGVIRFGTDNTGLTSGQLSQITADNGGKDLELDENGYLVNVPDFTYSSGAWTPSDPFVNSTATDNIYIADGSVDATTTLLANNLRIESGATLNVTSSGILDLNGDIINKGNLAFQSDATGSGQLAAFTGSVIGNANTERYIPARSDGERAFRFMSSSVGNVEITNAWQQQIHITGSSTGSNGFDASNTGAPSMFTYDHTVETQNQPWVAISTTEQDIVAGKPYRVFVRGDRATIDLSNTSTNDADDVTLSANGELHVGDFDVVTSNFVENYTFIGNPYQAVVNLNSLTYGDDVNNNYAYYWDPKLDNAGGFVAITLPGGAPDPGTSNANNFLRPGQAVFIRNEASGSDFSIKITESAKDTGGTQTQVFSEPTTAFLNMRLYTTEKYNNDQSEEDATGLRFLPNGNNAIDQMDAVKMGNPGVNLAIVNGSTPLAIENRSLPVNGEQVQLFANNLITQSYIFRFHMLNIPENIKAFLQDDYTGEQIEIETGINTINFDTDATISSSISPLRFSILFENTTLDINDIELERSVEVYPNPTSSLLNLRSNSIANQEVNVKIVDVLGRSIQNFYKSVNEDASIQLNTSALNQGIYFIKVSTSTGVDITKRFIKK